MQLNLVALKDGQAISADYTRYMEYSVTKNRDRFLNSLFFEAWMSTSSAVRGYSGFFFFFFSWASVCGGNLTHAYEIETKGTMEE